MGPQARQDAAHGSRALKILLDSRYIRERPSGIGEYVLALASRVPRLAPDDRFRLWLHPQAKRPVTSNPNVDEKTVRAGANSLATTLWAGHLDDLRDVDVFHATFNVLGRGLRCASVVTMHDLMWLLRPSLCEDVTLLTPFQSLFYRDGILRALKKGSMFVAISKATADSMHMLFPELRSRTRVIYHGLQPRFVPGRSAADVDASVARLLGKRLRYFLVVGQNSPSKNHRAVLEAFAAADLPPDVHLVLLQRLYQFGRFGIRKRPGLLTLAERLGIHERTHFVGSVTNDDVVELYRGALGLIQYSRFEGFGMPALEAMACGTPVVTSDIAPLVEVLGGAGLHAGLDPAMLAQQLSRLARDAGLERELRARGLERARDFSWDRSAALHLEVYREAARLGPR